LCISHPIYFFMLPYFLSVLSPRTLLILPELARF
jgi:hypothetical protein